MQISATLPISGDGVPDVGMARHLEDLGFDRAAVADLLIGDGTPGLDPSLVLAAAAQHTHRIGLEFGVLSLPLRPVALVAAQIQALQHLSGNRTLLGTGIGGFPGSPFWRAAGAPLRGRGRWTDAALAALPGLVRGEPTEVGGRQVTLAPGAAAPLLYIGGNSEAAMRRAVRFGDGWVPSLITPAGLAAKTRRLREIADELDRPVPAITVGGHAVLTDSPGAIREFVGNMVRMHGVSAQEAADIPVTGDPEQVAARLAAYSEAGAGAVTLGFDGGDWPAQAESLARARSLLEPGG
ncbi:hypothetical protein GCM10027570_43620 [Streptomonospora sediminis]